jgi:hypothetical protein
VKTGNCGPFPGYVSDPVPERDTASSRTQTQGSANIETNANTSRSPGASGQGRGQKAGQLLAHARMPDTRLEPFLDNRATSGNVKKASHMIFFENLPFFHKQQLGEFFFTENTGSGDVFFPCFALSRCYDLRTIQEHENGER